MEQLQSTCSLISAKFLTRGRPQDQRDHGGAARAGRPRPDWHRHHDGCPADAIHPGAADPPPKWALPDGDQKNQPTLYWAAALVFDEPPVPARPGENLTCLTQGKGHGRLETRRLASTTALNHYLRWPDVAQVLRRTCRRVNLRTGHVESEVTYGLTSLPRELAGPAELERF